MHSPSAERFGEDALMAPHAGELLERDSELGSLDEAAQRASTRSGTLVVVAGPAGVGKTSLLEVVQQRAADLGMRCLRARGSELERQYAYGVARQLYEPVLRATRSPDTPDGSVARTVLGIGQTTTPSQGSAFLARQSLYWVSAALAEDRPLLLTVDDAHWADPDSLQFLHHLARRLDGVALTAVVAWRTGDPAAPTQLLDALADEATVKLAPRPLTREGTAAIVRQLLDQPAEDDFAAACHEATGGNPFMLRELLLAVDELRGSASPLAGTDVRSLGPTSIARSVLTRVAALWPDAVELARATAVLDNDAELSHAARLAGLDVDTAARAADALVEAGVLATGPLLRFTHPVVRQAVYSDLPRHQRAAAHLNAARVLAPDDPDRAALHAVAGAARGDAWIVELLCSAAKRALHRGNPTTAAMMLDRALQEPPLPGERGRILLERGRAAHLAGEPDAAAHLEAAIGELDDLETRAAATRLRAAALAFRGAFADAVSALERMRAQLPANAHDLRSELTAAALAACMLDSSLWQTRKDEALRVASTAAGRTTAERVLLAMVANGLMLDGSGTAAQCEPLATRSLAGLDLERDDESDTHFVTHAVVTLMFCERVAIAERTAAALLARARRTASADAQQFATTMSMRLALWRGDLRAAEEHAQTVLDFPEGSPVWRAGAAGWSISVLLEQGRDAEADALLEREGYTGDLPEGFGGTVVLLARAALRSQQGRTKEALGDAEECLRREVRWDSQPQRELIVQLAPVLRALGREQEALGRATRQLERAQRWGTRSAIGSALVALALAGPKDDQLSLLREAAATLAESPCRLDRAHALVELGGALRRDNRRADAREPLWRGMELARACGASVLATRAREELRATGARPRSEVRTGLDALTPRERQVTRLAAAGRANTEIAQALFLTVRTVEMHLSNSYRKLDITSRRELPTALGD